MDKLGFDNQKYLELQSAHIRERIRQFGHVLFRTARVTADEVGDNLLP